MAGLNSVQIIGNLGGDPEMRFTPNGNSVTSFPVAVSQNRVDTEGNKVENTEWFSVITWNKLAETCNQYLSKGQKVYVEGRLQTRSWEKDEQKHYKTEVIASHVLFLDKKVSSESVDMEKEE